MPKGFSQIKKAAERIESYGGGSGSSVLYFKLPDDGDSAVVRFLEQGDDVYSYWYHDFSTIDEANGWRNKVACLDQDDDGTPCPGCERGLSRRFEGLINLIWRDAPLYEKDSDGKYVKDRKNNLIQKGNEDQIAIWRSGITVFSKVLARKDVAFKGLASRDFQVTREGTGLDTTYSVEPADPDSGASKMSKDDIALAEDKYDLEEVARIYDYDKAEEVIKGILDDYGEGNGEVEDEDIKGFLASSPLK